MQRAHRTCHFVSASNPFSCRLMSATCMRQQMPTPEGTIQSRGGRRVFTRKEPKASFRVGAHGLVFSRGRARTQDRALARPGRLRLAKRRVGPGASFPQHARSWSPLRLVCRGRSIPVFMMLVPSDVLCLRLQLWRQQALCANASKRHLAQCPDRRQRSGVFVLFGHTSRRGWRVW